MKGKTTIRDKQGKKALGREEKVIYSYTSTSTKSGKLTVKNKYLIPRRISLFFFIIFVENM